MNVGTGFGINKGNAGGGSISGSGTNNYVARWTPDGTTLGDSIIQDDGTSLGVNFTPFSSALLYLQGDGTSNHGTTLWIKEATTVTESTTGLLINQNGSNEANTKKGSGVTVRNATNTSIAYDVDINSSSASLSVGLRNDITNTSANGTIVGVFNTDLQSSGSGNVISSFTNITNPTSGLVYGNFHEVTYNGSNTATAVYGSSSEISVDGTAVVDNYFGHSSIYGETTNGTTTNVYLFRGIGESNNATNLYGLYIDVSGTATNKYAVTLIDGTEADGYILSSDANGNGSWADPSTLVDTIYTADGSFNNDRTVDLSGYSLTFNKNYNINKDFRVNSYPYSGSYSDPYFNIDRYGGIDIMGSNPTTNNGYALSVSRSIGTSDKVLGVGLRGGGIWNGMQRGISIGDLNNATWPFGMSFNDGEIRFSNGTNFTDGWNDVIQHRFNLKGNPIVIFNEQGLGTFTVGGNSRIGSESISLQGHTLIQGQGNTSGTTALEVENIDGDSLLTVLDNGRSSFISQVGSIQASAITVSANSATFDGDKGNSQPLDLTNATGDITLTFTNLEAGFTYFIEVTQKASSPVDIGTYTIAGGSATFPSGTAPVISTGANAVDTLVVYYNGTDIRVNFSQNYS